MSTSSPKMSQPTEVNFDSKICASKEKVDNTKVKSEGVNISASQGVWFSGEKVKSLPSTVSTGVGVKFDLGKPRMSLLSADALLEIGKVAGLGAAKYGDHNWRNGMKWSRLLDAAQRHILSWQNGQTNDEESSVSHLAHAAWNLMALLEYEKRNMGTDDIHQK